MSTPAPFVPNRPDRWIFVGLVALLVWLPLPWGSKPATASGFLGLAAAVLALLRLFLVTRGLALPVLPPVARWVQIAWLAWLGWALLYVLPLPAGLLKILSPSSFALHDAVAGLPNARPLYTLSIGPSATLDHLVLGAAYFCLFWVTLVTVARNRLRQRWLLVAVMLSGLAQALYGSVMTLSGWEYGFFEPKTFGHGWASGTFVNRNHFAGYLELTLAAAIALVLADLRESRSQTWKQALVNLTELLMSPRIRTRVVIAIMVIALVLTRSRMGNVAFFVSLAICANVYVLLRNPKYLVKSLLFFAGMFLIDLLIISEHYGLEKVVTRLEQTDLRTEQRSLVFRDLVPVIKQYGVVGSGPGTFSAAFSPHRSADVIGHFDHAHNDYAEFLIETGFIGSLLMGAIAGTTLLHGFLLVRRRRDPMAGAIGFCGAMALLSLGIHGLVDFNLRIPAVAGTLVALLALTLSCSTRSTQHAPPPAA